MKKYVKTAGMRTFALKKRSKMSSSEAVKGYLFALPWFIGFFVFTLYPVMAAIYYSFCSYDIVSPPQWINIANYKTLINEDPLFWKSLFNTVFYTFFSVPLGILIALILAVLLNYKLRGMSWFRTIFYLPTIVPVVASCILWLWILNPQFGLLNVFLAKLGIAGPGWLADENWSKPSLILMSTWAVGGSMIIFLAGLQGIPRRLYEAAELDGANWWRKLISVTVPMLSPAIFFNMIMGIIGSFQVFTQVFIMTDGGPVDSTLFYVLYLYRNAFVYFKMGYASAMALILFIIILFFTLVIVLTSSKWVYEEVK